MAQAPRTDPAERARDERGRIAPDKFDPDQPIQVGEKFFREVLDAFHSVVAGASDATHLVFRGSEWKTLCTVVREDGTTTTDDWGNAYVAKNRIVEYNPAAPRPEPEPEVAPAAAAGKYRSRPPTQGVYLKPNWPTYP